MQNLTFHYHLNGSVPTAQTSLRGCVYCCLWTFMCPSVNYKSHTSQTKPHNWLAKGADVLVSVVTAFISVNCSVISQFVFCFLSGEQKPKALQILFSCEENNWNVQKDFTLFISLCRVGWLIKGLAECVRFFGSSFLLCGLSLYKADLLAEQFLCDSVCLSLLLQWK